MNQLLVMVYTNNVLERPVAKRRDSLGKKNIPLYIFILHFYSFVKNSYVFVVDELVGYAYYNKVVLNFHLYD